MTRIKGAAALLALLTSLATFFVIAPGATPTSAAPAQTCSSIYGCLGTTTTTATTTPPGGTIAIPQCIVSRNSGAIGVGVDVTITNVPVGVQVNLLLNGVTVDTALAVAGGNAVASLDSPGGQAKSARTAASKAAPAQTPLTNVHFAFRVPTGPAGSYTLTAQGAGFHCDCFPFTIERGVDANNETRPGNNGGNLARTGFTVLGLLIVAAMLLVFGRAMVEASRRRSGSGSRPAH